MKNLTVNIHEKVFFVHKISAFIPEIFSRFNLLNISNIYLFIIFKTFWSPLGSLLRSLSTFLCDCLHKNPISWVNTGLWLNLIAFYLHFSCYCLLCIFYVDNVDYVSFKLIWIKAYAKWMKINVTLNKSVIYKY